MSDPSNDLFKQQAGADWEVVANGWQKWHATFENAASNMSTKIMEMAEETAQAFLILLQV